MALPAAAQTWTFSVNNTNTFVTTLVTMQAYARSLKNFLKTTMGYTVKGSCTVATGAMDGVDRWTADTDVTPQGATSGVAQAWVVLTDGNGCDICMAFQGATSDVFRFSFSPGGLFVAAGTPANQPTATDECVIATGQTIVNATASANRVFHFMATTDKRMFRAIVHRSGAGVSLWGVEKLTPSVLAPAVFSPPVWGHYFRSFVYSNGGGSVQGDYSTAGGGVARVHTNTDAIVTVGGGGECFGAVGGMTGAFWANEKPDLQGNLGEMLLPLTCVSLATSRANGELGTRIDWWGALTNASGTPAQGDTFDGTSTNFLVAIGAHVLPWDHANTPVTS
jgi:hypothetical protein